MAHVLDAQTIDPAVIAQAAQRLAAGELVAFPTETVYGLGARADDASAVAQIFSAKGRPSDHPLIVHVADAADAADFASDLPPVAQRLMAAFWPGPLTVIVPRRPDMAAAAAGGQGSVGLRCPAHPVAQALLRAARERGVLGVAAPSANRFGRVSPTRARHVVEEFAPLPDLLVLDGGDCAVGIESTIVDCTRGHAVLLRPGDLTVEQLEAVAGEPVRPRDAAAPRASGTLASHYAPRAQVRLMAADALRAALTSPDMSGPPAGNSLGVYSRTVEPVWRPERVDGDAVMWHWRCMPLEASATAHDLFAVLRELDSLGVVEIWVEAPPDLPAWDGVRDRLHRAAAPV